METAACEREDVLREVPTLRHSLAESADRDHLEPSAPGQQSDSTLVGRKEDLRDRETLLPKWTRPESVLGMRAVSQ